MDSENTSELLFECGICMDTKTIENIDFLPCIHFICISCRDKLIKNECPFCRNVIYEEKEEDSYDDTENEYDDVHFEMLVMEEKHRPKRKSKRFKKQEKRIMKLLQDKREVYVNINNNTLRVLSNLVE